MATSKTHPPAVKIHSYDPKVYSSLLDFSEVAQAFRARKGKYFIRTVRELYLRHNVEECLGVGLVHRHFDLDADERLVQEGNKSAPWKTERANKAHVVPSAWAFRHGALYPYEFEVASGKTKAPELPPAFVAELYMLLLENGYQETLGINTFHGGPTQQEHTEGRTNILTPVSGDPATDHTAPASWGFFRWVFLNLEMTLRQGWI